MVRRYALLLATPVLLAFQLPFSRNAPERPDEVQQLAMFSKPSVVRIITGCFADYRYERDYSFATGEIGTGFFISPNGYIVTNSHVVENADKGENGCRESLKNNLLREVTGEDDISRIPDTQRSEILTGATESNFVYLHHVYLPAGDKEGFEFEIKQKGASIGADSDKDVAVIKIEVSNAPVLKLVDSSTNSVSLQDKVLTIGYPAAADLGSLIGNTEVLGEATVSVGAVSNPNKTLPGSRAPVIQVDNVQVSAGSSGSPLLNQDGEVVGMITFSGSNNDIVFAITAPTIQEFVRASGATNESGSTDALYREGLNLYWRGNLEGAKTKFEAVRSNFEYHSESNRLIRDIDQQLAAAWEQRNYTFWLALAAGAVVLLGAGYFLARWRTGSVALAGDSPNLFSQNTQFTEATSRQTHSVTNTVMSFLKPKTAVGVHPHLVLSDPTGQVETFVLNGNFHRLGRNPNCDLRLPDSWGVISKQHAVLEREGGNYRIYDGDRQNPSTNKIFINQTLVTPQEGYLLNDGDELKIGQDPNTQVTLTYSNPTPNQSFVAKSPSDRNSSN